MQKIRFLHIRNRMDMENKLDPKIVTISHIESRFVKVVCKYATGSIKGAD